MIEIFYATRFIRQYKKLPEELKEEVKEKIAVFQTDPNTPSLKAHKLKGELGKCWSFWVNYKFRIVYKYDSKSTVVLLKVGDHDVYK